MGKLKLTEAQRLVLIRMAAGDEAWTITGRAPSTFWRNDIGARSPSFATLHALWKKGAITNYDETRSGGDKYIITPAGRAALADGGSEK